MENTDGKKENILNPNREINGGTKSGVIKSFEEGSVKRAIV